MAASLLSRAAAAAAALRGGAQPNHLLARAALLPKETFLPPLLLLLLLLFATATPLAGRVGWAVRAAEGAGGSRCGPSPLAGAFGIAARCNATSSSSAVSEAAGLHTLPRTEPVASAEWLHANLKDPDVKVLDASWYMPAEQRNPLQEYQVAHIPGALFFDVDGISDRTSSLPHMLPSEKAFSAAVSALGICNKDGIVVYDGKGLFSAARVWWMFRVFGHDKVWVLDGGLPQWRASGYDVESSASSDAILKASAACEAIEKVYQGQSVGPATFEAKLQPHLLWSLDQVKENINTHTHQLIDARSKPRFDGAVPEPRKGIRSGHVPGSKCVPFPQVDALLDSVKWDSKGLAVAIAQNVDTGAILAKTISTRKATFFSRSRSSLWTKGETSMNFINVHDIFLDCDRDSIIYIGKPDGPTCHTGAETCYYTSVYDALQNSKPNEGRQVTTTLYSLEDTIRRRQEEIVTEGGGKPSWTKKLLLDNQLLCSKIREEAGELIQTLLEDEDPSRAASEMADLLYHAMVLLRVKDVKKVNKKKGCKDGRSP